MQLILNRTLWCFLVLTFISCKQNSSDNTTSEVLLTKSDYEETLSDELPKIDTISNETPIKEDAPIDKNEWSDLETDYNDFLMDIRYATSNNFTKKVIYDCPRCLLRPPAAKALDEANRYLKERFKLSIKVFDCYRPRPYQQRLWDIVPNASYVTPPARGSMHSRGMAVDLTLVDEEGVEVDMGTEFDFFGEEAHQGYSKHSDEIKRNRYILRSTMEKFGFKSIRTEWWHFSYGGKNYPLSDYLWECN